MRRALLGIVTLGGSQLATLVFVQATVLLLVRAVGPEMAGRITPHSFRHYFVTSVLRGTGNLRVAQELARHSNIQVTQRYTHLSNEELDKAYYEVFEKRGTGDQ